MVVFAAATGLRPSELLALERRDVDRAAAVVYVRRAFANGRELRLLARDDKRLLALQTIYDVGPVLAGEADLVVGSRRLAVHGAAAGRMPLHQRLGNDWLAFSLFVFFGLRLSDDGPYRAVRLDLLERLRLEERAYAFPTEMVVKARLVGARIAVRDTCYRPRAGHSKIAGTWAGTLGAVRDIFWCLLRLRLFGFRPRQ